METPPTNRSVNMGPLCFEFVAGGVIFLILQHLATHIGWIARVLPMQMLATLLAVIAVLLYTLRTRARLAYATVEIYVGFGIIVMAAMSASKLPATETAETRNIFLIQFTGGVYVVIRGLDNFWNSPASRKIRDALGRKRN